MLGFPGGSDGKESACNAADSGLIPRVGGEDPPEKGMATLENSMDRGVWWATVCGVAESDTLSVC